MDIRDDAGFFAAHTGGEGAIWLVQALINDNECRFAAFSDKSKGELWLKVLDCDTAFFYPLLVNEPDYMQHTIQ